MPTEYEVINKTTGEITPVTNWVMGENYVEVEKNNETGEVIRFSNEGQKGNLLNDTYFIRQIVSKQNPSGTAIVNDDGTESPIVG